MKEHALAYFKKNGSLLLYAEYSKFLGKYYHRMGKYKRAAFYLNEANIIYEEMLPL
ncbi:hypothetical protein NQ095_02540 [Rossellomorea sp. SC111]|uniref:hypothetical protein n=1 Tax=Rossellomorea sp. SC111 TaxID=2968985 RepID=UPI00215A3095|nr:hypothetical protein [Rossellomorea sp. SC111]MCR8847274.1 hypothetical protein [Rossellomorea sp. SC111]